MFILHYFCTFPIFILLHIKQKCNKEASWLYAKLFSFICVHTTLSCACTPCCCVHAHHVVCVHTTPSCACTKHCHVHAHHIVCVHTRLCTPHNGVHFSQISLQSHATTHLSQSEGSILPNLSDFVRNCKISPKIFPPFKEQSCYNSSAKKWWS